MNVEKSIFPLLGKVQNYAWGGHRFIPDLVGFEPEPGLKYAEYWLGAHDKAPSEIVLDDRTKVPLNDVVSGQPERILGQEVARRYGRLPFLYKILDVREMLSIQVHPTKAEAEAGFARENDLGIPLDSPVRNYKDNNHKPEIMVALSDFWLLHGFLQKRKILNVLDRVPEFHGLRVFFEKDGYRGLYKQIMEMPVAAVDALLEPLVTRVYQRYKNEELDKSSADYWTARVVDGNQGEHYDRGIFSIYFFNLVHLKEGQAIFQDAGIPHAYLEGQNVELMANSDNVLRGGLTQKHVDVVELLRLTRFEGVSPKVIAGKTKKNFFELFYEAPTRDFLLNRIELPQGSRYEHTARSVEINFVFSMNPVSFSTILKVNQRGQLNRHPLGNPQ
jgi:mannose-6-phosphate isomerase